MNHPNPMKSNGYVVIATASHIGLGAWRGSFTAEKEGAATINEKNLASFASREEAEQQALALARTVIRRFAGQ